MCGCTVQVVIILLDIFPVITLAIGQSEHPLLQDRVLAIPERQRKTQPLLIITDTGEPIFTPVIGARAGLIVSKIIPRVAVRAVILADSAPLPFAEIGPPRPPGNSRFPRFVQSEFLSRVGRFNCRHPVPVLLSDMRGRENNKIRWRPRPAIAL